MHFHAIIEIPRGEPHSYQLFGKLSELETFVKSDQERKVLALFRTFRMVGSPYILPPGTPAEQVATLRDAMRKTFKDPAFHKDYLKLSGDEPTPIMPEAQEKSIKELPREVDVIDVFKTIAGNQPLPPR